MGAVSPIARAVPRIAAEIRPLRALGSTTRNTVFHCGAPSASDASRRLSGTMRNISSDARVTVGMKSTISAIDPAKPENPSPSSTTQNE